MAGDLTTSVPDDPAPTAAREVGSRRSRLDLVVVAAWVAAGVLALALVSLALRSAQRVADVPLVEDAWYALSAARNVAEGNGPTIDGEHLTNGFQPLFTFLEAPPF
ncbi:hypothetical protein B7486_54525, partial [cyanobacterium TDX16]